MIRVRQPVRLLARRGQHDPLLEREHRLGRAGQGEHGLDLVPRLRVRGVVARALDEVEADPGVRGDLLEHEGGVARRRPQLQVRGAPDRKRAAAEERASQVRRPAAGPGDDPARRPLERRVPAVEDPRSDEHVERPVVPVEVELVSGPAVERAPLVRPDLERSPSSRRSANARRAAAPLPRSRWIAHSPFPRRCRLPAAWKSADSSASRSQRRVGAICASSSRTSSDEITPRAP